MKSIFYLFVVLSILNACTPDYSEVRQPQVNIPAEFTMSKNPMKTKREILPDTKAPREGFRTNKRPMNASLIQASLNAGKAFGKTKGRGGGKPVKDPKPEPPTDTTGGGGGDDTTYTNLEEDFVIFYDFDGGYEPGGNWSINPITLENSGMTELEIATAMTKMRADYAFANVLITADSTEYFKRPKGKRARIYVTTSYEWYGRAGGVAYLNSFTWGDDTPAFVFSGLLGYSGKYISGAGSHEAGHTIGLRHDCDYLNGVKQNDYSVGIYPDQAPIMGVDYYDPNGGSFIPDIPTDVGEKTIRTTYGHLVNEKQHILNFFGPRKY